MARHLKKLSEETIHSSKWWDYKHDTYAKIDGTAADYFYIELAGCALVIPRTPDGRLVLVLQERYLAGKQSIEFPAGGIKKDEDPAHAAAAELLEETGYLADEFVKIGVFEPDAGVAKDETHVYLADVEKQGQAEPDETETIEVLYRRPDEVEEMVRRNEIWHGQTLAAWALARHHFFRV